MRPLYIEIGLRFLAGTVRVLAHSYACPVVVNVSPPRRRLTAGVFHRVIYNLIKTEYHTLLKAVGLVRCYNKETFLFVYEGRGRLKVIIEAATRL